MYWDFGIFYKYISGFDLSFWSAVVKIYPFTTSYHVGWIKIKIYSPTPFPRPWNSIFLTITENKFSVWNYHFSGLTHIYLFQFSNIDNRIKFKICSNLTIDASCRSGVFIGSFKGCVHYIFASLFFMSKREHLWNKEECFLSHLESPFCSWDSWILTF